MEKTQKFINKVARLELGSAPSVGFFEEIIKEAREAKVELETSKTGEQLDVEEKGGIFNEGWHSPSNPPTIPNNRWRHKKPFLVVDENGETHIAIYATVDIRDGDMFIGEYEPKWIIVEKYSDRYLEVIENPKVWAWLPTFV